MNKQVFKYVPLLFCLFYFYIFSLQSASQYVDNFSYYRVRAWIETSECSRTNKVFLAYCSKPQYPGNYAPVEDINFADDKGHNLIANIMSLFFSTKVTKETLVKINFTLSLVAILLTFFYLKEREMFFRHTLLS